MMLCDAQPSTSKQRLAYHSLASRGFDVTPSFLSQGVFETCMPFYLLSLGPAVLYSIRDDQMETNVDLNASHASVPAVYMNLVLWQEVKTTSYGPE